MQLIGASEPGSLKLTRINDQCGFKTARVVRLPEWSQSVRQRLNPF